jgi:hypothetical protein
MAYLESQGGAALSANQAITTTADSTNVWDVTGQGAGSTLPSMIGSGGVSTALGYDVGGGDGAAVPDVLVTFGTCTTVSGTLTVTLSCAPDNGSGSAGSYVTLFSTAALTGATQLFKGASFVIPIPSIPDGLIANLGLPRFYKLTYTVSASISLIVSANVTINAPNFLANTFYGNNFPAGL